MPSRFSLKTGFSITTLVVVMFVQIVLPDHAAAGTLSTVNEASVLIPFPSQFESPPNNNCPPYPKSVHFRPRRNQVIVGPTDNWEKAIENARKNTTILLKDGVYRLHNYAVAIPDRVTVRSASGNRHSVVIRGRGYRHLSEGFMITGNRVTIADLSITAMRNHAIAIKPGQGAEVAPTIYNVHLYDVGTQHIKGNQPGTSDGIIACSLIGNTPSGVQGDYNGAIDLHGASNWLIRDNVIYNIRGDGSGCEVDKDCGTYVSGPAILVWNKAKYTTIERNYILDSYRNIALGLGRGHVGGVIRNNYILQATSGDAGIELQTASDTIIEHNTVVLSGGYPGAIEFRQSKNLLIHHNRITSLPLDRGDNGKVERTGNTVDTSLPNDIRSIYNDIRWHIEKSYPLRFNR